ncbi:hypothetical protein BDV12DRAFT_175549 [Aspergillus spectabilis]
MTSLQLAAEHGNRSTVEYLVEAGANIKSPNKEFKTGMSAVLRAARNNLPDIVRLLLDAGAQF